MIDQSAVVSYYVYHTLGPAYNEFGYYEQPA